MTDHQARIMGVVSPPDASRPILWIEVPAELKGRDITVIIRTEDQD